MTNRPTRRGRVLTPGGRLKLRWGGIGIVLLWIVGGAAVLVVATPLGRYLARGAWEEMRILRARQPITRLVRDSSVAPETRAKLALVLEARTFAEDSLGLPAKEAFTQFTQLDRDTLLLVLSGARKDWLSAKTWWFPVVGRVPYKGYFETDDALRAERDLAKDGYDTYLRPAAAFSTLGWFNDPLLSSTLRADSVDLVNTVIHELTHNRYFAKGEAVFNESFANFVGARGAERFFLSRGDSARAARAVARWDDDRMLGTYWARLFTELDSAFRAHPGDSLRDRRLALRDSVYAASRRSLVDSLAPLFRTIDTAYATRVRLDNAALLARRIYLTDLDEFERVFAEEGRGLERSIVRIIREHRDGSRQGGR
ncbi:MAG: aminopeptidase [Gemmatimonadales bacterium]|nr:aminopeptidase [Gemmatimonadales bacterium]